ncbi:MAG: hypothetical protein FGM33_09425 [Candidatus Kapabacteria bacterium]|nr:hypothetical protein [Candidatus Kapabacteria bacterium]
MRLQLMRVAVMFVSLSLLVVRLSAQGSSSEHIIRLVDPTNQASGISILAPSALATSYSLTLPPAQGTANQVLVSDGSGVLSWSSGGSVSLSSLTGAVANAPDVRHFHPQTWTWSTLGGKTALSLSSTHTNTAGGSNNGTLLAISATNDADTAVGISIENSHSGGSSTNRGVRISVTGGSTNIGLEVTRGNAGFMLPSGTLPSARCHIGAGTASLAPLKFTSGTNLTNAEKSAVEFDGFVFYTTIDTLARGVLPSKYFVILDADNTLTSSTAAQALFDGGGGPANGSIDLQWGLYEFEMLIHLTSLSTTGALNFSFGGTATLSSLSWKSFGARPADVAAPNASVGAFQSGVAAAALSAVAANSSAWYYVTGVLRMRQNGSLTPLITLGTAAAGVVKKDSYFKISRLGPHTAANVGRWK